MSDRPSVYVTVGGYSSSAVAPIVPDSHENPLDPNPLFHWWHPAYFYRQHSNPRTKATLKPVYTPGQGNPVHGREVSGNDTPDNGPIMPIDPIVPIHRHIPVWGGNPPKAGPLRPQHQGKSWR